MKHTPKITIIGIGNILFSDEGLGVRFIKELANKPLPENVLLLEGGTGGLKLFQPIQETDFLIIIDAINTYDMPGALFRFRPEDLYRAVKPNEVSSHEIGILDVLAVAKVMGQVPQTLIFGVQPKSIEWGIDISPEIEAQFPFLTDFILSEINSILREGKFTQTEIL